jgi:hypothetical protein
MERGLVLDVVVAGDEKACVVVGVVTVANTQATNIRVGIEQENDTMLFGILTVKFLEFQLLNSHK